jgi:predicted dehydrogenase
MALEVVESGVLGELIDLRGVYGKSAIIRYDTSEWRCQRDLAGGGILLDQGIHMIDMMRLMAGDFPEVHSFVSNSHWRHDVEDNAYAIMRTKAGVVAMIQSSATQWRHRFQLDITLTKGSITLTGILSSTRSYGAETITIATPTPDLLGDPNEVTTRFSRDTSWQEETDDFLRSLDAGTKPNSSSSKQALKTMEAVYAIYNADPDWNGRYGSDWSTT